MERGLTARQPDTTDTRQQIIDRQILHSDTFGFQVPEVSEVDQSLASDWSAAPHASLSLVNIVTAFIFVRE